MSPKIKRQVPYFVLTKEFCQSILLKNDKYLLLVLRAVSN